MESGFKKIKDAVSVNDFTDFVCAKGLFVFEKNRLKIYPDLCGGGRSLIIGLLWTINHYDG